MDTTTCIKKNSNWNVPNAITIGRLFIGLYGLYLWNLGPGYLWLGFTFVGTALLLDFADGEVARRLNQKTRLGEMMDHIVDKIIIYSTCFTAFPEQLNLWIILPLLSLEVMSVIFHSHNSGGAINWGKWKFGMQCTAMLVFALPMLPTAGIPMGNFVILLQETIAPINGNIFLGFALVLALISIKARAGYPTIITAINMTSGFITIYLAFLGKIELAIFFIFIGLFADLFDGMLARKLGIADSLAGKMADSAADFVTFGIASAILPYSMYGQNGLSDWDSFFIIGGPILYVTAVLWRLKKDMQTKEARPKGMFLGLPSPAASGIVVLSCLLIPNPLILIIIYFIVTLMMIRFDLQWTHFQVIFKDLKGLFIEGFLGLFIVVVYMKTINGFLWPLLICLCIYLISPFLRKKDEKVEA